MGINQGPISLDQKYTQETGHVFTTGIQALVRLPMAQIRRDRANGLNTAGFISGYRGSPIGGYDLELWAAQAQLIGDPGGWFSLRLKASAKCRYRFPFLHAGR